MVPKDGTQLAQRWREELRDLGFTPPTKGLEPQTTAIGRINRDALADLVVSRLGARRSAWNAADLRGEVERIVAAVNVVAAPAVRGELVEDLTSRAVDNCEPLLARDDVPEHIRTLTSHPVLEVEADLVTRLAARAEQPGRPLSGRFLRPDDRLDPAQQRVVRALAGHGQLLVVEGTAGAGKTTVLADARLLLEMQSRRLVAVTPTLKAAEVAREHVSDAFSAAWLVHQHGFRWDDSGRWTRLRVEPTPRARLRPRDLLVVDEAGMLDQDTARALLTIADEAGARIAFVGDRHQLPAVGRGGVLDLAHRWADRDGCLTLDTIHRFADPEYADLSLKMRSGERSGEVFDALVSRGEIVIHRSDVERQAALTSAEGLIVADTREQVAALNAAIRDRRLTTSAVLAVEAVTTAAGEQIGVGDRIATRRNDRDLRVANRDCWTVIGIGHGNLRVHGRSGDRTLPATYVHEHVELAYATTIHGAQGETVDRAHLLVGETTGAAAAYVGMTRGRKSNTAHLVADSVDGARAQWIEVFNRDRADLGPAHAAARAKDDIERYGPQAPAVSTVMQRAALRALANDPPRPIVRPPTHSPAREPGIGR